MNFFLCENSCNIFVILVFIVSDLSKSRQKLLSQYEMDVGDINPKTIKTIRISLISLVDGNLELKQLVRYKITDDQSNLIFERNENESEASSSKQSQLRASITLEYFENAIVKSKHDTIAIPCVPEIMFKGNFLSLNREPIKKAMKYEEFFFQVEAEIKSIDIEILDMFLITVSKKNILKSVIPIFFFNKIWMTIKFYFI